jgi:hypothetical protein
MAHKAANGVIPVSIFRDTRVNYLMRRLGEATDEFFEALLLKCEELKPKEPREEHIKTVLAYLTRTVPTWSAPLIKQRVDRILELARDFESALHAAFAVYVKDTYAEDLRGRKRKVQIRMPRVADFVHIFFTRIILAPEVKRGAYFDKSTVARNFAVSNAMMDALAECCVDHVRVQDSSSPSPPPPPPLPQHTQYSDADSDDTPSQESDDDSSDDAHPPQPPQPTTAAHSAQPTSASSPRFQTFVPPVTIPMGMPGGSAPSFSSSPFGSAGTTSSTAAATTTTPTTTTPASSSSSSSSPFALPQSAAPPPQPPRPSTGKTARTARTSHTSKKSKDRKRDHYDEDDGDSFDEDSRAKKQSAMSLLSKLGGMN